jgi:hypothetical protein
MEGSSSMKSMPATTRSFTLIRSIRASIAAFIAVALIGVGGDSVRAEGLTATNAQIFHQDVAGIDDTPELGDQFGSKLATGDFNGDGFEDLAIGIIKENLGGLADTGAVSILYGASSGLYGASDSEWWPPDVAPALGLVTGGQFGFGLASGDFNGDGHDDLAAGEIEAQVGPELRSRFRVRLGSPTGLGPVSLWSPLEHMPGAMTAGNLNADAYDDLIVNGSEVSPPYIGWIAYSGSSTGLSEANGENVGRVPSSLAMVGLDGDSGDEFVAGYPTVGPSSGGEIVIYTNPLVNASSETWHQDSPGIQGSSEAGDEFGAALAVGDFDGDGCEDLQVGVPGEDFPDTNMGVYQEIFGDCSGLTDAGDILVGDSEVQAGARFGSALAAGNFDEADLFPEIASAAPLHDVGAVTDAGRVRIRWTTATTTTIWHQDVAGVPGASEAGDDFGRTLATGDFNGDGADDLAIGVPLEDVNGNADAGSVNVLYGTPAVAADGDSDDDGCTDIAEQQTATGSQMSGGLRNYQHFWDFFDTPDAANIRDKAVAGTDFFRILARFGATGSPAIDPLSTPPAAPAYHSAFDRAPAPQGQDPWDLSAADGAISGQDFFFVLGQFGHECS